MWERSELKAKAKTTFKRYYWKAVLVSFIAFIVTGGMSESVNSANEVKDTYNSTYSENYMGEYGDESLTIDNEPNNIVKDTFGDAIISIFIGSAVVVLIITLLIKLFIAYPIQVGTKNYFMGIRKEDKPIGSILCAYKSGKLKNTVITMFMMNLFTFLWTLLLLIPGIVKSYEYRMIPYILSENPNISRQRAFEITKDMMNGNKWEVFVLDLSFIGWYILSALTVGILSIFYVNPYVESTNAELYAHLREEALEKGYALESELIGF